MGVLMSKKQTVEQVQKVSLVVSAFKDGLKERGPGRRRAEPSAGGLEVVEVGAEGEEGAASDSQACSEVARKYRGAWARLRDGKGVEPEELEWEDRATPPAFIRPKRQLGDDQSLDINLAETEEVRNEEMCEICEVWTADELFPCRVCPRVYHDGCLRRMACLSPASIQELQETALTMVGWSCHYCDNVNLLLTEEEMFSLKEIFHQCRVIPESCLTSDDFLHYKHQIHKQLFERQMSEEQEEEVLAQFSALDGDRKGQIEWSDFLYHESLMVLQRFRSQNSLLRLVSGKELSRARAVFLSLSRDSEGRVTGSECQRAQTSWFRKHSKESQSCNVSISHVGPISESSPSSRGRERAQDKSLLSSEDNRLLDWKTFLKESAIYILAARPNSLATHLRPDPHL
ncbi:PHD finger protein 24 [Callorhinchus milii]|uniref:PHD finger protein 24 n=1 Tax=Callorhinchus milii TaxID=7868 RepID=UPI001C3FEB95|nr:PHD finger protein 24 [Callorhinchus milii]XP_042192182.1 PHD finger protein 24 [Callorhinchus milii]